MCGRYYFKPDDDPELRSLFHDERHQVPGLEEVRTGEVFPTNLAAILILEDGRLTARPMVWGFPKWDGKGTIINAKSETALDKPMFRKPLTTLPAVIPTSGFFEWTAVPGKRKKDKYIFREPGHAALYLAGFYNRFAEKDGPVPEHFIILTTEANAAMASYHNRMPVLLHKDEIHNWLDGSNLDEVLYREPFALVAEKWADDAPGLL